MNERTPATLRSLMIKARAWAEKHRDQLPPTWVGSVRANELGGACSDVLGISPEEAYAMSKYGDAEVMEQVRQVNIAAKAMVDPRTHVSWLLLMLLAAVGACSITLAAWKFWSLLGDIGYARHATAASELWNSIELALLCLCSMAFAVCTIVFVRMVMLWRAQLARQQAAGARLIDSLQ